MLQRWLKKRELPRSASISYAAGTIQAVAFQEMGSLRSNNQIPQPSSEDEIKQFKKQLESFGITFALLAIHTPKELASLKDAQRYAYKISNTPSLLEYFHFHKELPLKLSNLSFQQKLKLKRNKIYITAITLIHSESYQKLISFLPEQEEYAND